MGRKSQFSPEARERAVRMLEEHQGEYRTQRDAICSIATMIGCSSESLRRWLKMERRKRNQTPVAPTLSDKERIDQLERENRQLRRANEILRLASAYFAQAELDRLQNAGRLQQCWPSLSTSIAPSWESSRFARNCQSLPRPITGVAT